MSPLLAFHQHLHGTVRQFQHLQDGGHAAHIKHVGDSGLILGSGFLCHQHDATLGSHGGFQGLDALGASHKQRNHHVREDHHIAQR